MSQKALPFAGYGQFGIITAEWMSRAFAASRRALRVAWAVASLGRKPMDWVKVRQSTLAEKLGYAAETVRRALRELRTLGLLEARAHWHPDGGQGASEYRLLYRKVDEPEASSREVDPRGAPPPRDGALRSAIVELVAVWSARAELDGWGELHSGTGLRVTGDRGRIELVTVTKFVGRHLRDRGFGQMRQRQVDEMMLAMADEREEQYVELDTDA